MSSENIFISDVPQNYSSEINPLVVDIVLVFFGSVCTTFLCLFGIAANIVNIPLFRRQGYRDGVNVTLTALAVSDLGAVIFELAYTTILNPYILDSDLVISKVVIRMVTGYTHEYFTRVSSVITAFAALERCLCVTRPLKVKTIITTKVAILVNAGIFAIYSLYLFPQFYSLYFDWTLIPERNKTVFVVYFTARTARLFPMTYYFTDILLPYCTFLVLISCCAILFTKLKSKAKWRQRVLRSGDTYTHLTTKEQKSGLLFMSVSVMCVVLFLPEYLLFTVIIFIRSLALNGYLTNIGKVVSVFTSLLKTANSSFTIFIYYNMSTKYRQEFQKMLGKCLTTNRRKHPDVIHIRRKLAKSS